MNTVKRIGLMKRLLTEQWSLLEHTHTLGLNTQTHTAHSPNTLELVNILRAVDYTGTQAR